MDTINTNNVTISRINSLLAQAGTTDLWDYSQETVTVYDGLTFTGRRPNFQAVQATGVYQGIVCEAGDIHPDVKAALQADHPGCFFVVGTEVA